MIISNSLPFVNTGKRCFFGHNKTADIFHKRIDFMFWLGMISGMFLGGVIGAFAVCMVSSHK